MFDRITSRWALVALTVLLFVASQAIGVAIGILCKLPDAANQLLVNSIIIVLALLMRVAHPSDLRLPQTDARTTVQLIVGLFCLCLGVSTLSEALELPDMTADSLGNIITAPAGAVAISLVGPFAEECFFRAGIVGGLMRRGVKMWWAIGISALLFGLIHINPAQVPFAMCIGISLGYCYVRSGSILIPLVGHILNNSFVVASYFYFGAEKINEMHTYDLLGGPIWGNVVAALIAIAGALLLWNKAPAKGPTPALPRRGGGIIC